MNILDFLRLWPVLNNLYFVIRYGKTRRRKDISQILYRLRVEFAFLCFGIKTSLVEMLEYFLNMPVMFRNFIWVDNIWVDKYIIQIDYNIDIQKIRENVIYESLKGCRSIGKTKEYYRPLKWSIMRSKISLLFIIISNANQMVSMVKIYLWVNLSFMR